LQALQGETAWAVIFIGNISEDLNGFLVFTFRNEEFGRLFQSDDGDSEYREDKHQGPGCVPDITPSLVIGPGTGSCVAAGVIGKEGPRK
jgi:hypothetical protein